MLQTLVDDLDLALDATSAMTRAGMTPDPWQEQFLLAEDRKILLNCHRQSGKTTVTGAKTATHIASRPNAGVLLLSRGLRQSGILFKKVKQFYRDIGAPVPIVKENTQEMELANDSWVVSLPGTEETVRGFSAPTLIIVDEAARVSQELLGAVRPMLATTEGQLILLSTPWGQQGVFYWSWRGFEEEQPVEEINSEEWWEWRQRTPDQWLRFKYPATANVRISNEFLEAERVAVSEWFYAQEFLCEFRQNTESVFDADAIRRSLVTDLEPLFDDDELETPEITSNGLEALDVEY